MDFDDDSSSESRPQAKEIKNSISSINWEPIGNLILNKRKHQLRDVLNLIRKNYTINSKKLLLKYPDHQKMLHSKLSMININDESDEDSDSKFLCSIHNK